NGLFVGIDPHLYYCMIRHFKPRTIIEVGAGFSTLIAAQATTFTGTQLIAVEPYPRDFIKRGDHGIQHIGQKAEALGVEFFDQLQAGDFLFIDSSHVIKTGGDVNYLVLNVLPRLNSGVIIHIHDIFLPYEYPREWLLDNHWFWTEQYLIQAFLIHNAHIEVLLANHWLEMEQGDRLKRLFPQALKWTGGSLWLRVK
ncbi:MAG TPA: class I SAM-dependent methyltransferase, partial [Phototrophicaceae bacterium]|nr:class I SAM-dependent methyltransferase [Phototrophicaceae bacterium]